MASLRVLLLLLVSSSLLHLSEPTKVPPKAKEFFKSEFFKQNLDDFLKQIPYVGALVSSIADVFLGPQSNPVLTKVKSEFESLNIKLDKYHVEQKWDTWASGAYHQLEVKINNAWRNYEDYKTMHSKEGNDAKKKALREEMIRACSESWDNTATLHAYLTARPVSFMSNLGETLAESLNCHEKDIMMYAYFIGHLLSRGIDLSRECFKLKEITIPDQAARETEVLYDAASAMLHVWRYCVLNSAKFIRKDMENLMGGPYINKQKMADEIRSYLNIVYARYDWMVVVFQTDRSNHDNVKMLNKHTVEGFMKVERDELTVAVARQVKGTHSKGAAVQKAINECVPESTDCHKVPQKLSECKEMQSRPYTAVHAFLKKPRQSYEDELVIDISLENEGVPNFYVGKCKKYKIFDSGKFVVMIKSDEERAKPDPCSGLDCGGAQRGSCVRADDVFVAMCQCNKPFFGPKCEHDMTEVAAELQPLEGNGNRGQLKVVDKRRPRERRR